MTDTLTKLCAKLESEASALDATAAKHEGSGSEFHAVITKLARSVASDYREALATIRAQTEALAVAREGLHEIAKKWPDSFAARTARTALARIDALTGKDA